MKLKINEDGSPAIANGHPVYLFEDGREEPFDAAASVKKASDLEAALASERVATHFDRSKYIAEKLAIPSDMVRAKFASAFKLEGEQLTAFDKSGNKIFSRIRPGEAPDFDEALEILVNGYENRDSIIRKANVVRDGPRGGSSANDKKTLKRSTFETMAPAERMTHIRSGGTIVDG